MTFGEAIEVMEKGEKVCRSGWNGKGMFVYMTPGSEIPTERLRPETIKYHYQNIGKGAVKINPHIDMKAADGSLVIGWLASQTDMLATDWKVY